jgi:hypothetical protein
MLSACFYQGTLSRVYSGGIRQTEEVAILHAAEPRGLAGITQTCLPTGRQLIAAYINIESGAHTSRSRSDCFLWRGTKRWYSMSYHWPTLFR